MPWLYLVGAGLLEIMWAIGIKYTEGFTRLVPSALTISAMAGSFYLLSLAMKHIPIGTAYAVWVGIGAAGVAIAGMIWFKEPASFLRIFSVLLIVTGVIGLKLFTPITTGD